MATSAILIASAVVAATGAAYQGYVQYQNAQYQQKSADLASKQAAQAAQAASDTATAEANQQHEQAVKIIGTQRAAIGESGTGFGGNAVLMLNQSAQNAASDNLNIAASGQAKASSLLSQSQMDKYASDMYGYNANMGLAASGFNVLNGGLSGYTKYNYMNQMSQISAASSYIG